MRDVPRWIEWNMSGGNCNLLTKVTLTNAEPFTDARAAANNPAELVKYFNLLQDTIQTNALACRPGQILICNETGMSLS